MKWLESGTRRDMCALLYAMGEASGPRLKRRLEKHHESRIEPRRFYERLDALVSAGHVDRRTRDLDDVYALTDAGERALLEHYDWLGACLRESDPDQGGADGDPGGDGPDGGADGEPDGDGLDGGADGDPE